jgi:hypothetical protein
MYITRLFQQLRCNTAVFYHLGSVSCIDSNILFIYIYFILYVGSLFTTFLLPRWSKKQRKNYSFYQYFSQSIFYLLRMYEIILGKGPAVPKDWETLQYWINLQNTVAFKLLNLWSKTCPLRRFSLEWPSHYIYIYIYIYIYTSSCRIVSYYGLDDRGREFFF